MILNGSLAARLLLSVMLLLFSAADVSAKMYRWVDDSGKVHFTDDPMQIPEAFREGNKGKAKSGAGEAESTMTPLHHAALAGDTGRIESLVDDGADVNAADDNGMTALHFAAEKGRLPAVKLLLNMGARYDVRTQEGKTAADLARGSGQDDVAGLLDRHAAKKQKKRARRPARPDPYEEVARATGGQVFRFEKGMAGADEVLNATYQAKTLLSQRIDPAGGVQELTVPLESSITSALFVVTAVKGKPRAVSVLDPAGVSVHENPAAGRVVSLQNGQAIVVKNPAAGNWKVRVTGRGDMEVRVEVKTGSAGGGAAQTASAVDFHEFEFVELRGRPGHQGFFTTRHPLVPGAKMKGKATVFGELTDLKLQLVDEAGSPIKGSLKQPVPQSADSWDYLADFIVPDRPFRVMLTGSNEKGEAVSRVYRERFAPDASLVHLQLSTATDARKCATAMNLLAYPFSSERSAGETLFVSCPVPEEQTPNPELNIIMTAYTVAPPPGGSERVVFRSHPKQNLNTNRCWAALELFDTLKTGGERRGLEYRWKADCRGTGDAVQLVLEWDLSAK